MDIVNDISAIRDSYGVTPKPKVPVKQNPNAESFSSVFQSVVNMVDETNTLQNKADAEEIRFALGLAENTHDMAIAQSKAQIALQYTVAVRDKFIQAYQQIMQMQV